MVQHLSSMWKALDLLPMLQAEQKNEDKVMEMSDNIAERGIIHFLLS